MLGMAGVWYRSAVDIGFDDHASVGVKGGTRFPDDFVCEDIEDWRVEIELEKTSPSKSQSSSQFSMSVAIFVGLARGLQRNVGKRKTLRGEKGEAL